MPTAINPVVLALGPSPGNSPEAGDQQFLTRRPYELPTAGRVHPGLLYDDSRGFFRKARLLFSVLLEQLHGLGHEEALALAGLLNLDTGAHGRASEVQYDPAFALWVVETAITKLRPDLLVCLGLTSQVRDVLGLVSPDLNHRRPDRCIPFDAYPAKALLFREWAVHRPDGGITRMVFWPQHPGRAPFTNDDLWAASVKQFALSCQRDGLVGG